MASFQADAAAGEAPAGHLHHRCGDQRKVAQATHSRRASRREVIASRSCTATAVRTAESGRPLPEREALRLTGSTDLRVGERRESQFTRLASDVRYDARARSILKGSKRWTQRQETPAVRSNAEVDEFKLVDIFCGLGLLLSLVAALSYGVDLAASF